MARRTRLTIQLREKVANALALGAYRKDAATFAGIADATFRRWLKRGVKEASGPYAEFREAVVDAEARAKMLAMGCVTKAIRGGDWKAAAWYLERKHPHQFADKSQLFLVAKALEAMEAAAEAAGSPLPEGAWEQSWARVAQELSMNLPHAKGGFAGQDAEAAGFDSADDLDAALRLLGAGNGRRPR